MKPDFAKATPATLVVKLRDAAQTFKGTGGAIEIAARWMGEAADAIEAREALIRKLVEGLETVRSTFHLLGADDTAERLRALIAKAKGGGDG